MTPTLALSRLQDLWTRLWATLRDRGPALHRCRFDSETGLLYASDGLLILRCACGAVRCFGEVCNAQNMTRTTHQHDSHDSHDMTHTTRMKVMRSSRMTRTKDVT